jgi:hypothetical protein
MDTKIGIEVTQRGRRRVGSARCGSLTLPIRIDHPSVGNLPPMPGVFPDSPAPGGNKSAFRVLIWMDQDDDLERKIAGLTESVTADIWLGLALAGVNTLVVIGLYIVFN